MPELVDVVILLRDGRLLLLRHLSPALADVLTRDLERWLVGSRFLDYEDDEGVSGRLDRASIAGIRVVEAIDDDDLDGAAG